MGSLTTYSKDLMLNALPSTVYAALYNGDPSGAGVEVSGGTYARQAVTLAASSSASRAHTASVSFNMPVSSQCTHVALFTASSGGTMLSYDDLDNPSGVYASAGTYILTSGSLQLTN